MANLKIISKIIVIVAPNAFQMIILILPSVYGSGLCCLLSCSFTYCAHSCQMSYCSMFLGSPVANFGYQAVSKRPNHNFANTLKNNSVLWSSQVRKRYFLGTFANLRSTNSPSFSLEREGRNVLPLSFIHKLIKTSNLCLFLFK